MSEKRSVSRREFLKTSAAAAAALSVAAQAHEQSAHAQGGAVPCGVIGTGVQGKLLLKELIKMKEVELVALCDVYQPHLDDALTITGDNVFTYDNYREMLDSHEDMQAVVIATPLSLHAEMSIQALQLGKHVFCESAMGLTAEQCKQLLAAVNKTGKVFQLGHQRRYSPLYRHAHQFVKSGVIGDVQAFRAQWNRKESWRRGVRDKKYEKLLNWRLYRESSGGLVAEFGCHQIDVANWFLNAAPVSVMGLGGIDFWKDGRTVYDNVQVLFHYPGDVKAIFAASLSNSFQYEYELIMGTHGTILFSNQESALLFKEADAVALGWEEFAKKDMLGEEQGIVLDANATKYEIQEGKKVKIKSEKSNYRLELEDFFACIREGKKPTCGAEEAIRSSVPCILANTAMQEHSILKMTNEMFGC